MKSVKDILRSPRFLREISLLLFFFAGLSGLFGLLLLSSAGSELEVLGMAVGSLFQAIIYVVLAILLRRGSIVALWITAIWFVLDTLFLLAQPSGKGLGVAIITRGLLVGILIRYFKRERASG
jgi:hypothetical protein